MPRRNALRCSVSGAQCRIMLQFLLLFIACDSSQSENQPTGKTHANPARFPPLHTRGCIPLDAKCFARAFRKRFGITNGFRRRFQEFRSFACDLGPFRKRFSLFHAFFDSICIMNNGIFRCHTSSNDSLKCFIGFLHELSSLNATRFTVSHAIRRFASHPTIRYVFQMISYSCSLPYAPGRCLPRLRTPFPALQSVRQWRARSASFHMRARAHALI